MTDEEPPRPRYGTVEWTGGGRDLVVFVPDPAEPDVFLVHYADTDTEVQLAPQDIVTVDALEPRQRVRRRITQFVCPRCGKRSADPTDLAEGYCAGCHGWTAPPYPPRGTTG